MNEGAAFTVRVIRAVEILPPLRSSDRSRRQGDALARPRGRVRAGRRGETDLEVGSAPYGTAAFVTQQIAQEWHPAPREDAVQAAQAYRRAVTRRHRDLLPKV
jgi:hypothetical protein